MNTKSEKNWYETILDSQKKMAETMNENAKKWNSNEQVNQALENGSEFFKKWLDFQMDFVKNNSQNEAGKQAEQAVTESFNNWKSFYENMFKNPNEAFQNAFSQNNNWFTQQSNMFSNPFMQTFNNPFMGNSNFPNMDMFNNWNKSFTEMYQNMMNQFKGNGSSKEVFEGMLNHTQSFMKFYELWQPVLENMQKSGFSTEKLKDMLKPEAYKEFMDSFFGFMPAGMKDMYNNGMGKWNEGVQNFSKQGTEAFNNLKNQWQSAMPNGTNAFSKMLNQYNSMFSQMQNAVAPFAKLIAPNSYTKNAEVMVNVMDMMNRYHILNSQMQYMTYLTGMKAMDEMGTALGEKVQKGETVNSMQDLFKQWLNTSDKYFVELFETEEFSKVQAETSSLTLRIKGALNGQLESMFANIPLVPRSEMDELYKTVYELKKRVRTLEKELENSTPVAPATAAAPKANTAKKSSK